MATDTPVLSDPGVALEVIAMLIASHGGEVTLSCDDTPGPFRIEETHLIDDATGAKFLRLRVVSEDCGRA